MQNALRIGNRSPIPTPALTGSGAGERVVYLNHFSPGVRSEEHLRHSLLTINCRKSRPPPRSDAILTILIRMET